MHKALEAHLTSEEKTFIPLLRSSVKHIEYLQAIDDASSEFGIDFIFYMILSYYKEYE